MPTAAKKRTPKHLVRQPRSEAARRVLALAEHWKRLKWQKAQLALHVRALANAAKQAGNAPELVEAARLKRKRRMQINQEMRMVEDLVAENQYIATVRQLQRSLKLQRSVMKESAEEETVREFDADMEELFAKTATHKNGDAKLNGGWLQEDEEDDELTE